ncbi:MAG: sulfatase family protein [Planctomycetota bacterium]|jgi:arylsulfatase A
MHKNLVCLIVPVVFICPAAAAESEVRPNIILMMADDMGLGDTSAYKDFTGNSDSAQVHTPQMDRLARMGVRFTDAHTPSSRCTPTRYALLTGRYPWRNRLKHWVLFGSQGDPMIERDRPTIATMLRDQGYYTVMVGKWHVGLRYRRSDGGPAAGWDDADLTQPLFDTPLDHGFEDCRITSRSHGTSGAQAGHKRNTPKQSIGPGHIHGRIAVGASGRGRKLVDDGPGAYVLTELGSRHSDSAIELLDKHLSSRATNKKPFFLYYACNSNHGPYTPDTHIGGESVAGAARNMAGEKMDKRSDYIYENDVALGRLLDYLKAADDPRNPERKLIETTLMIFTSDNGAEKNDNTATGPFRSNKGSVYEGGHRVPLIVAWPGGGIGDGDTSTPGRTSDALIGLQDIFATFAEILGVALPDLSTGVKGAEDSVSVLSAWQGGAIANRPMLFNDHKEAKDRAAGAIRLDDPTVSGVTYRGKWKLFFDADLLRKGRVNPTELYNLATDPREQNDRIGEEKLAPLVSYLSRQALLHRTAGGHRLVRFAAEKRITFDWRTGVEAELTDNTYRMPLADRFAGRQATGVIVTPTVRDAPKVTMTVVGVKGEKVLVNETFSPNRNGLGLTGGTYRQVDEREALLIWFDRDVIVESAEIVAGNGTCGGFYRMGDHEPLHIYCVDGDNDSEDQSGVLSDLGVLKAGRTLLLDSSRHLGVDEAGSWRLASLTVRVLEN